MAGSCSDVRKSRISNWPEFLIRKRWEPNEDTMESPKKKFHTGLEGDEFKESVSNNNILQLQLPYKFRGKYL